MVCRSVKTGGIKQTGSFRWAGALWISLLYNHNLVNLTGYLASLLAIILTSSGGKGFETKNGYNLFWTDGNRSK
jgi:hypothetical protein